MSYIGSTKIGGMYLGTTEIAKAYLGTNLVYQKMSAGTISLLPTTVNLTAAGFADSTIAVTSNTSWSVTSPTAWNDGSGDDIYLDYPSASGNQTVTVTADPNYGSSRTQTVSFTVSGGEPASLTVNQLGGAVQYTLTKNTSFYDTEDYSYYSISNASNAYASYTSTSECTINLTRNSRAETWIYYGFDTSSIPAGAHIDSVSCVFNAYVNTGNTGVIASKSAGLYAGTTLKGDSVTLGTSAGAKTLSGTNWTVSEVQNLRLKLYAKRGTNQTTTNHNIKMRGATLTVTYSI